MGPGYQAESTTAVDHIWALDAKYSDVEHQRLTTDDDDTNGFIVDVTPSYSAAQIKFGIVAELPFSRALEQQVTQEMKRHLDDKLINEAGRIRELCDKGMKLVLAPRVQ